MALTGVEKLYWAKNLTDLPAGATFDTPVYLPGVREIDYDPKYNTDKLYAEDMLWAQATTFSEATVKINLADLTSALTALMLGATLATEGGVYKTIKDMAPFGAILYKAPKANGATRYGVFYNGKFTPPKSTIKTKEEKTVFQTPELDGLFQALKANGMTEYSVDTDDANCPPDIDTTWFNSVVIPGSNVTVPTVTSVPIDAATGVLASANVVFTFSTAINPTTVTSGNVFLMKADGTLIASGLSVDVTNKIITVNPAVDLTAGAYVAVCTTNVKTPSGIGIAANSVVNFTV